MSESIESKPVSVVWLWGVRALSLAAAAVAVYLLVESARGAGPVGCGPGSACDIVLTSRWSSWLGVPVSALAIAAYLGIFAASVSVGPFVPEPRRRVAWSVLLALATAVTLGALWFIAAQVFLIGEICVYCMTDHALGMATAALIFGAAPRRTPRAWAPIAAGVAGVAVLIGGQFLTPPPRTAEIAVRSGDEQIQIDPNELPHLGDVSRGKVVISLFDYTCPHCRAVHGYLLELQKTDRRLSIVTLPAPLDSDCNPAIPAGETEPRHEHACELARLASAVWREKPDAFAEFDRWLFEPERPRPLEEAQRKARELIDHDPAPSPDADKPIRLGLELHRLTRGERGRYARLPKLLIRSKILVGRPGSEEELRRGIEEGFAAPTPTTTPEGR